MLLSMVTCVLIRVNVIKIPLCLSLSAEPLYQYVNYAQLQKSSLPYKSSGQPSNGTMNRMSMYETLGRRDSCGAVPGLGAMRVKLWRDLEEVSGCDWEG